MNSKSKSFGFLPVLAIAALGGSAAWACISFPEEVQLNVDGKPATFSTNKLEVSPEGFSVDGDQISFKSYVDKEGVKHQGFCVVSSESPNESCFDRSMNIALTDDKTKIVKGVAQLDYATKTVRVRQMKLPLKKYEKNAWKAGEYQIDSAAPFLKVGFTQGESSQTTTVTAFKIAENGSETPRGSISRSKVTAINGQGVKARDLKIEDESAAKPKKINVGDGSEWSSDGCNGSTQYKAADVPSDDSTAKKQETK